MIHQNTAVPTAVVPPLTFIHTYIVMSTQHQHKKSALPYSQYGAVIFCRQRQTLLLPHVFRYHVMRDRIAGGDRGDMSTGDRAIEASLQRLQEDKDRFLTTQSAGNDSALVSSIGSYAGALRGAGRHEEAQEIDRKRHEFKTAGSGKKLTIARGLTKTLVRVLSVAVFLEPVGRFDNTIFEGGVISVRFFILHSLLSMP